MNDDGRTDERIARAARELYHAPPATPRDEMWSAIEARLAAGAPADTPAGAEDGPRPDETAEADSVRLDAFRASRPSRPRPGIPGRTGWWIGIAAALLIGLGIGRLSLGPEAGEPQVAGEPGTREPAVARAPVGGVDRPNPAGAEEAPGVAVEQPAERVADAAADPLEASSGREEATAAPNEGEPPAAERSAVRRDLTYAVAAREHLDRSGTFLAGVRAGLDPESPNSDFAAWARSLLSRTRVLMASPAGRDPAMRRLLEDLELMLAQIAVTAATGDSAEARILGRGLENGDLLLRLRSAAENENGPGEARIPETSSL